MDKKLKAKWISALRSGRYRQSSNYLKDGTGAFCCLGVLANIQGCRWRETDGNSMPSPFFGNEQADSIEETSYLRSKFAGGLPRNAQNKLAEMNDEGKSFKEIADYIEKRL